MIANPSSPRIALLNPLLAKSGTIQGGIEAIVINLANGLVEKGYLVDLLGYPPDGALSRPGQLSQKVNLIDIGSSHKLAGAVRVAAYLSRVRPAALLAAGHRCNLMAALAKRLARGNSRVVLSVHNTMSQRLSLARPASKWLQLRQIRWAYSWSDAIVAVSSGVRDDLLGPVGLPAPPPAVIYNPVITAELKQRLEESLDHPWFLKGAPPVILAVGRLRPQKDYLTLVEAFARVRSNRTCRLMILGEGPERRAIEALIRRLGVDCDVAMPGAIDNPLPYMCRSSVYAMSSRWEGLPTVLIEALAAGAPIVSTDCPSGPFEILEGGRLGRLVPVGNPEALAEAISATLDSPISRSIVQAGAKRFEVDMAVNQYISALLPPTGTIGKRH